MILEMLKINIEQEKKLVKELDSLLLHSVSSKRDQILLRDAIASKSNQLKILNDSIPLLLKKISFAKTLPNEYETKEFETIKSDKDIVTLTSSLESSNQLVAIKRKDKDKYLEQLYISESSLKSLKKGKSADTKEIITQYKTPNAYVKMANKLFLNTSRNMIEKGSFSSLKRALEKGDFVFLLQSYVSTIFLTTLISFFVSIFIVLFLFFFDVNTTTPFLAMVNFTEVNILIRILKFIWLLPAIPLMVFLVKQKKSGNLYIFSRIKISEQI